MPTFLSPSRYLERVHIHGMTPTMIFSYRPMALPLIVLVFFLLSSPTTSDLSAEGSALMAFRSAVGRFVLSWNNSVSPCQWLGVTCSGDHVTAVHLPGCGLIGRIPAGILGNLCNLHTLSLRFNALSGPLPTDLFRCVQLRNLYLQGNRFSGVIPASLSSLTNLVRLNLADNNFSGAIPPVLNNLTRLGTLYLEGNHLSGEIPQLDLPNLAQFNISYNQLHGSVPVKLRALPVDAFLGMPLCGAPLGPCSGQFSPSPTPAVVSTSGGSKLSGGAIAGIAIAAAIVLLVLLSVMFLLCRRKGNSRAADSANPPELEAALTDKRMTEAVGANRALAPTDSAYPRSSAAASGLRKQLVFTSHGAKIFDLEQLLRASAEVLGKGTFGTTYKAVLETGAVVAVKRLRDANVPEKEFKEKVEDIGAMNHTNLVPLRAYYHGKDEKLLVYDYIPMGSLSSLLHGNRGSGRTPLKWEIRTSIALDAARGIEYIHSTSPTASHGNIKSSNILLGPSSAARVSDHGLARLVGAASASNRVAGYRAPEVTDTRKVSQKADVYSFGVLLLELLTGKAPTQAFLNEEGVDLPRWVQSVVREEWAAEVFDMELLRYQSVEEEMVRMLQLGVDCTAHYPDRRPTMSMVVTRIEEIHHSSIVATKEQ